MMFYSFIKIFLNILFKLIFLFIDSNEVETYVNNVKEQIMNTTPLTNSEYGWYYLYY